MALLSILSVSKQLICVNNYGWLMNLNLIYETVYTGLGKGLFILIL